jgi:hypothetical protein
MTGPTARSRRAPRALAAVVASLAACTPPSGQGLAKNELDTLVAQAIGDPSTCLLLADRATGQVVYQYGDAINCARPLPRCDGAGVMNARAALQLATEPGGRLQSCPSVPDGSRTVGWAEGRVQSTKRDLIYSAVMEGQNALPGHEISARLYDAFAKAGL